MPVSKASWITVLVGAIIQLFTAYRMVTIKYLNFLAKYPDSAYLFLIAGALYFVIGFFMFYTVLLLRKEKTCRRGSIFAIILSILGLNIVALVGAIIGFIKSRK